MTPLPGDLLAERYEILEALGSGGFARAYRARRTDSGEAVGLIVLIEPYASIEALRTRFLAEARAQAEVRHPHLVGVREVLATPIPTLVTDWVEGPSLAIPRRRTPIEVRTLLLPVLDALATVHAAGLIHGDLVPGSILVPPGGAVLADLGVVRRTERAHDPARPRGPFAEDTPESDLYAMAVLIHELLTGKLPIDGVDPALRGPLGFCLHRGLSDTPYANARAFADALGAAIPLEDEDDETTEH